MEEEILDRIKQLQEEFNSLSGAKRELLNSMEDIDTRMTQISGALVELNSLIS